MYCGKCGKEIPEGQSICENCTNKIQTNSNDKDKSIFKKPVKITLIIILAIILLSVIITIITNSTLKKTNNLKENIETNNSIENEQQIKKSYIAENGQEFNINALELVKQIVSAQNIDEQNEYIPINFNYTQTEENNYIFYTIYRDSYFSRDTMPPFIVVAHKDSGNVFRIAKYLYYADVSTKQINETASSLLYQYLFTALYSLGQNELVDDITNGKLEEMNMTGFIEKLYVSQPGGYDIYGFEESTNNVIDNITSQTENMYNSNNTENESTSSTNENTNNITSSNNNHITYENNNENKKQEDISNNNSNNTSYENDNSTQNPTIKQIKLPNLVDLTEAEAINKLESLGLEYSITRNTKQVAFDNPNAGKSIVTNIIDKKDYYSQYDRVHLEVNQYQESGISIGFIINTKELVNYVKVYVDNKEYSAHYFPNMSSETFYSNGRKSVNVKIVLNNYSENIEIYNKNINLYEANKTVSDNGHTSIDIGTIDYKS